MSDDIDLAQKFFLLACPPIILGILRPFLTVTRLSSHKLSAVECIMAFRFSKRIKIAPGVRLNVSKSGLSTSLGGRGVTANLSSKGVRTTIGVPGSGLSWSKQTGWAGSRGLKPADELLQLRGLLDKLAKKFNSLSPQTNKVSASWNKALASFDGGRGPSTPKFQTLSKRFDATMARYQKVNDTIVDQKAELAAIFDRLNGIRFGMFSGKLRSARNDLLTLVQGHESGARRLTEAIDRLRGEVSDEYSERMRSIQSEELD